MTERNPILSGLAYKRATPQEKFDAMMALMDDYQDHTETVQKPKKRLIHISETIEAAKELMTDDGSIVGLSTGYKMVDQMMKGIRPGDIVVVFGDTMHGKSLFAQNVSLNIAANGTPILFIGTELVNDENTERFLAMTNGREDLVASLPILYPEEVPGYKEIDDLTQNAKENGAGLIVIDHLHMFETDGENEAVGLSNICKELKRVAVKHGIPILLVSHINEDKYRSGAPHLKDLKGSSSIKQIASFALAIYNGDKDPNRKHEQDENILKVVLRKWRRGNPKQHISELSILPNARLGDQITISAFPSHR